MHVEVVYALPARQHRVHLELEHGATVADALTAVGRVPPFTELDLTTMPVGIFGRRVKPGDVLQGGDRVEVYRPLLVDPKEARRQRAAGAAEVKARE